MKTSINKKNCYKMVQQFKFGQISIQAKDFNLNKQFTDIYNIDFDNIVVSDPVPCNDRDHKYIIGYKSKNGITQLLIKTPKNVYSSGITQYSEGSKFVMGFNLEAHAEWRDQYIKIWDTIEEQLFQTLTKAPLKNEWLNAKLKQYDGYIKTDFSGKDPPHHRSCDVRAVLNVASVYNKGCSHYPQVYVDECRV